MQVVEALAKRKKEFVDNFWLNLGDVTKIQTTNPFILKEEWQQDDPVLFLVDYMRRPENFGFTCKHLLNIQLAPMQLVVLQALWNHSFPMLMAARGGGKSFILGVYALLRAIFDQGSKIIINGAAFRQAKIIFEYAENIWKNSPMLQDILSDDKLNKPARAVDLCSFRIGQSKIIAIPTGNGQKIRGLRATCIITDEFRSIDINIFEHVISPFASVTATPVENMIQLGRIQALQQLGHLTDAQVLEQNSQIKSNQNIISGTPGYCFEPFYKYFQRYKGIIQSKGDYRQLEHLFEGDIPASLNHKEFAIVRMPYDIIPPGYMDVSQVEKQKATIHLGIFQAEFGCCFIKDSEGFFRRSLIERCVCGKREAPLVYPSCGEVNFSASLYGSVGKKYVYGIDPASEVDNFSITILELWPEHRRIIFSWTVNRKRHKAKVRKKLVEEHDYYRYCARKIRDLMRVFPTERIMMDKQGGGVAVFEALSDPNSSMLQPGEKPLWETIVQDEPKDSDNYIGEHIIEFFPVSDASVVSDANHGMKKDFEDRCLIFPQFDSLSMALALEDDKSSGRVKIDPNDSEADKLYDTLEDCFLEIEDLKNELVIIEHTKTEKGRDHWDTPKTIDEVGKKGRLRKDRYSSLLMANYGARQYFKSIPKQKEYQCRGGFAHEIREHKGNKKEPLFIGPTWYTNEINKHATYGRSVGKVKDE